MSDMILKAKDIKYKHNNLLHTDLSIKQNKFKIDYFFFN